MSSGVEGVSRIPAPPTFGWLSRGAATVGDYLALTKLRVVSLLLWTTVMAMIVAEPSRLSIATVLWTCLGGYLAAGGAGAINHYIDRDIDARMTRTSGRPLAEPRIAPIRGLWFGISMGAAAGVQLAITVNLLAAALAIAGLLGYVFVYTLWLKRRTPQNIVIGGAAGAVPPLVGWAAASGGLTLEALYLFGIVFFWTPPHFWALALLISDDYERAGVPMLPVVRGDAATRRQVLLYAVVLVGFTVLPFATGMFGSFYLGSSIVLGTGFLALAIELVRRASERSALRLYLASLLYLAALFGAMALDVA